MVVDEFKREEYYNSIFDVESLQKLRLNQDDLSNLLEQSVYSIPKSEVKRIVNTYFSRAKKLGLGGANFFPYMNIPLSSTNQATGNQFDLEFLTLRRIHSHPKKDPAPDFVYYTTKLVGYSLTRLITIDGEFEKNRVLYQPSSEIRAALMTNSKQEIFDKVFKRFGEKESEYFMKIFENAYEKKSNEVVNLREITFDNTSSWNNKKQRFIGHAGSFQIPSLLGVKVEEYEVDLKNPSQKIEFHKLMMSDHRCSCGTHKNEANDEGTKVRIHCHHFSAAENIVNKGLKNVGSVKITNNTNVDINNFTVAKVFEPLTNLEHPLVAKFIEWYYFKDLDLWTVNLNLNQFPMQILHPKLLEFMVRNHHVGYANEFLAKRFRLNNNRYKKGVDSIILNNNPAARKSVFSFQPDSIVSFPKHKNYPNGVRTNL
ncbi:MAG: hypothetical protein GON13_03720 [Nanoarchaeota archaeon]|nr:hypothetical protein [Nanoarchaeota archaeon]